MTITPADALDLRIAQGPPQQDLGGQISKLPDSYWAGLDEAYKRRNQDAFKDGVPLKPGGGIDTTALYDTLLKAGGTVHGPEIGKQIQQQSIIDSLQGMGGTVFPGSQPTPAAPQPAPMQQPPVSRAPGGDNGQTVMGAATPHFGEADVARPALAIAQRLGVDVNAPLPPEKFAQAQQLAQTAAQARRPVQQPTQQPTESPGTTGVENDPTLGGLIPPGRTVEQHLGMLRKAAALAQSTGVRDAGKSYIDAIDAIQKRLQPTDKYKDFLAGKKEGETYQQWLDRDDKNKQELSVLQHSIIPRLEKSQEQATGARDDLNAIDRATMELNANKGIFSGILSEQRLQLAKFGTLLGLPDDRVASTEAFKAAVGTRVMGLVKGLGSGTSISNSDRVFAEKMAGGQIQLDEASLRRIFDIGQRAAAARLKQHNTLVDRAVGANPALKQFEGVYRVERDAPQTPEPAASPPARPNQPFATPDDVRAAVAAGQLKSGDTFTDANGKTRRVP